MVVFICQCYSQCFLSRQNSKTNNCHVLHDWGTLMGAGRGQKRKWGRNPTLSATEETGECYLISLSLRFLTCKHGLGTISHCELYNKTAKPGSPLLSRVWRKGRSIISIMCLKFKGHFGEVGEGWCYYGPGLAGRSLPGGSMTSPWEI